MAQPTKKDEDEEPAEAGPVKAALQSWSTTARLCLILLAGAPALGVALLLGIAIAVLIVVLVAMLS